MALVDGVGYSLDNLVDGLTELPAGFDVGDAADPPPLHGEQPIATAQVSRLHRVEVRSGASSRDLVDRQRSDPVNVLRVAHTLSP
jgi:hypothetical protein